jgi:hypothetical protein
MGDVHSVLVEISMRDTDFSPENYAISVILPAYIRGKRLLGKLCCKMVM